ncbi:MAG: rod shape-determining protein MreC, partial [Deltaproteobacteria bacterium]|nr:rod shape-determining protein MreC [Deltaproteobacteria bacterium]
PKVALLSLFLLVAPLFSMYFHGRIDRPQSFFETALMHMTGPGQSVMNGVFGTVVGWWKKYVYLVDMAEQNEELRQSISELKLMAAKARGLDEENRRLRDMLAFRNEHKELRLLSAQIIARETSPYFSVSRIRLDRGSDDSIAENMPVLTAAGVVGRIEKVAGQYCDIMLITDSRSRIDVQIPGKGLNGTLAGTGDGLPVFRFPFQKARPAKGEALLTTGHDRLFPKGLVVGFVAQDGARQSGKQLEAAVEPAVSFASLQEVFVAVSAQQQLPAPEQEGGR